MSADGSAPPPGAWKPPPGFKFGAGFQPKPRAAAAPATGDTSDKVPKRTILRPTFAKSPPTAPTVSPPKESNGDMARARLQPTKKPAAKFSFAPPKPLGGASEPRKLTPSRSLPTAADAESDMTDALPEDTEFAPEVLELVQILKRSAESVQWPGVVRVCEVFSPVRINNTIPLSRADLRIYEFLLALSSLPFADLLWFMKNRGYELLLLMGHHPSFANESNKALRTRYMTKLSSQPDAMEGLWQVMRASFEDAYTGSTQACAAFAHDLEHLALHAGLQPETLLDLAKEHPALRVHCADILVKLHAAHSEVKHNDGEPRTDVIILMTLVRLCGWALASGGDDSELSARDEPMVCAAAVRLTEYLRFTRCPVEHVPVVANFTLGVARTVARHSLDQFWVVPMVEVVLGQADALSERVMRAIAREDLLKVFASHLAPEKRSEPAFALFELLLIPYLPDGSDRKPARITKPIVDACVKLLFTDPTGGALRGSSLTYSLVMLHLSVTLASEVRRRESKWPLIPRKPTPNGLLSAVHTALVQCMEGHLLPPTPMIPRGGEHNALLAAVIAMDALGCGLLMSCGWDPYLEHPTPRGGRGNNEYCAFIKAIATRAWDVVRTFLQRQPEPINRLFITDIIADGKHELMPALTRLAYSGHADLMRILLEHEPSVAAHRFMGEAMSPMHAAVHGSVECVSLLLAHGVDAKEPEPEKAPHLVCALTEGRDETVRLLIEQGVTTDREHRYLFPAYDRDRLNKTRVDIMKLLLANGADPMERINRDGNVVDILQQAMLDTNAQVARLLLDHGAVYTPTRGVSYRHPFWGQARTRHSDPCEILRLMIGHNLPYDMRSTWDVGGLQFLCYPEGQTAAKMHMSLMEVLLEYGYFAGSELITATGHPLASVLDTTSYETRALAELLIDFGCPPGERESESIKGRTDLVDYVPTKRVPTGGYRFKVNGKEYHYIPWRQALHPYTPRIFRDAARTIAHLRLLGDKIAANTTETPTATRALWASLPLEIFEIVLNELYQHVRASAAVSDYQAFTDAGKIHYNIDLRPGQPGFFGLPHPFALHMHDYNYDDDGEGEEEDEEDEDEDDDGSYDDGDHSYE